jgi:hypothetical protein
MHELKLKNELKNADCSNRRPNCLPFLRDIESNRTLTVSCLQSIVNRLIENLTLSGGDVCRQSPALWPTVGYMKLCVDRDLNCGRQLVT